VRVVIGRVINSAGSDRESATQRVVIGRVINRAGSDRESDKQCG